MELKSGAEQLAVFVSSSRYMLSASVDHDQLLPNLENLEVRSTCSNHLSSAEGFGNATADTPTSVAQPK